MLQTLAPWFLLALLGAHLALALVTRQLTREAEAAHPPIGRFLERGDGTRLHYRESGPTGPTPVAAASADAPGTPASVGETAAARVPVIVLVHGASTSLLDFESSLRPRLERSFRVIAVDRPGSGWSDARDAAYGDPIEQAADVVRVLDALGIGRATWVGHSWGGAVVMAALLEHAERVAAGVAIAAATHPWEASLPRLIRLAATPGVGHLLAACWVEPIGRRALDGALRDSFRPESPPVPVATYRERTGAALTIRPRSFRATALDLVGLSAALERLAPRYGDIRRPLLLINGAADPAIPPARNAARVAAALPSAETVSIPGAGHIVHHTHADVVAARVREFALASADRRAPVEP